MCVSSVSGCMCARDHSAHVCVCACVRACWWADGRAGVQVGGQEQMKRNGGEEVGMGGSEGLGEKGRTREAHIKGE